MAETYESKAIDRIDFVMQNKHKKQCKNLSDSKPRQSQRYHRVETIRLNWINCYIDDEITTLSNHDLKHSIISTNL